MTALDQLVLSNLDHLSEEGREIARERLGKSTKKKKGKKDDLGLKVKVDKYFMKYQFKQ